MSLTHSTFLMLVAVSEFLNVMNFQENYNVGAMLHSLEIEKEAF